LSNHSFERNFFFVDGPAMTFSGNTSRIDIV
jgi:hypothetical protein